MGHRERSRAAMALWVCALAWSGWNRATAQAAADPPALRVQILNGRTGRPVANQKILLTRGDGKALDGGKNTGAMTDGEGYAAVPNADAATGNVQVAVGLYRPCSKTGKRAFSLVAVRASGVVSENACKPRITMYPQAGVLIFFVRPETLLEKIRR